MLFQAKVNTLEYIHRERIAPEDSSGATDYLNQKSITNELAVLTPYEVKFKCFTPELASALSGFASSPNGLLVKTINVELAPAAELVPEMTQAAPIVQPIIQQAIPEQPTKRMAEEQFRRRYGLEIIARLDTPPDWARIPGDDTQTYRKGPPANYQDYGDFVYSVASRALSCLSLALSALVSAAPRRAKLV